MGNCLKANNQISALDHDTYNVQQPSEAIKDEQGIIKASSSFKLEQPAMPEESMKTKMKNEKKKKKKKVRFEDDGDSKRSNCSNSNSTSRGPVRIRLMVTREELQRILRYENGHEDTSLEQLLLELRRRRICGTNPQDDGAINAWRPSLESIPEDRLMK